ncbi:cytochrome c7-like protein [Ancylomarina subtilis]|uniref:Cytochrome c7-like protein n=1 Tax=Ancylomarina subtilis TaxID=1639035 RepID=A0A4Q7VLZ2_9BACT|nr:cytochrome c3 family protein [Ancylomarina subtilis]RZT97098.1 cytochrome c7-like protein [Ancylomarina subtilis]
MSKLCLFISIVFFLLTIKPSFSKNQNNEKHEKSEHNFLESSKQGERLFKGLLLKRSKLKTCISCHNLAHSDTLNWNPSAWDIAHSFSEKEISDFNSVINNPIAKKMSEVHAGFQYSDEELGHLKNYLLKLKHDGTPKTKPVINNLILFLFLGLLITLALIDLFFTKKIKYKFIPIFVFLIALGYQMKMIGEDAMALGRNQDYAPDQPIKFSHKVHATDNKLDCRYCHTGVETSKSALIPSANVCLNCHLIVREGRYSGKFEINKIHAAIENNKPIKWVRIHKLPDFVFFSHAQHVKVGKRECQECHGEVEKMHILRQVKDLSMGWCLDCHDKTVVDYNRNHYYTNSFKKLHEELTKGTIDSLRVKDIGGRECGRCHY